MLSAKSLLWKSVFIHIEIGTNYCNKDFALRLALKERLKGTWKWPVVYTTFVQRVDSSSIVARGNHIPADMPCQNQIDLLSGASFIQWVVLCTHPFNYCVWIKKTALKGKTPYDLLYSWYLKSRCFIIQKRSFGLSPSQPSFGMSRNAPFYSDILRADRVVDCRHRIGVDVLCCSLLVIGYVFLITTYCCACWDLEEPEVYA